MVSERPSALSQIVGQTDLVRRLRTIFAGSAARGVKAPHVLLSGPAGHGKTTLARIIAEELGAELVVTSGPMLRKVEQLAALVIGAKPNTVLFIDEIHRLPIAVEEALYEALEDGTLSIITGSSEARAVTIKLPTIYVVGATTAPGALPTPFRDRFGAQLSVQPYSLDELTTIVEREWARIGLQTGSGDPARIVAERCKGVPRLALHLAQRVADYAATEAIDVVGRATSVAAMECFGIGERGLDEIDYRILRALVQHRTAMGLEQLAQMIDLDAKSIERDHERGLVRAGLVARTSSGRLALPAAHELVAS